MSRIAPRLAPPRLTERPSLTHPAGNESEDGAPVAAWDPVESFTREGPFKFMYYIATGNLQELAGGPLFLLLAKYYNEYGPAFKLAFGPRSFIVISDPVMARHILTQKKGTYDKVGRRTTWPA